MRCVHVHYHPLIQPSGIVGSMCHAAPHGYIYTQPPVGVLEQDAQVASHTNSCIQLRMPTTVVTSSSPMRGATCGCMNHTLGPAAAVQTAHPDLEHSWQPSTGQQIT
mmetsp:Transcript_40348/g.89598  ORF Transcript_40348/g.89598 Transcript_40348/m.89598 type:complete len:107 (-) Transcript_40348:1511-1831(-)